MSEATAPDISDIPDPYSLPLDTLNPLQARLFQNDAHWKYFERLRAEDPVHMSEDEDFGRYWHVTKFNDIMYVDTHHDIFSSEGGITIGPRQIRSCAGFAMPPAAGRCGFSNPFSPPMEDFSKRRR